VLEVTTTVVPNGGSGTSSGRGTPTGVRDSTDTPGTTASSLPSTGGDTQGFLVAGLGLILAGAGLVLTTRRKALRPIPVPVEDRRRR
jgi:LPXTG-motif cell wall-anchored protein